METKDWPILLKNSEDDYCLVYPNGVVDFPLQDEVHTSAMDVFYGEKATNEANRLTRNKVAEGAKKWLSNFTPDTSMTEVTFNDKQKTVMRDRIVEICYDDYLENITQISYADLVSDLFYQTADTDWTDFEAIPEEWLRNFIKANEKASLNVPDEE